jgi:hypothetical protein
MAELSPGTQCFVSIFKHNASGLLLYYGLTQRKTTFLYFLFESGQMELAHIKDENMEEWKKEKEWSNDGIRLPLCHLSQFGGKISAGFCPKS